MSQKQLITETLTCPVCGYAGDLDDFDCAGLPDGVVICEKGHRKPKRVAKWKVVDGKRIPRYWGCGALIDVATGQEYTGPVDDDC